MKCPDCGKLRHNDECATDAVKIITEFVNPPIPHRGDDWSAVRDGYEPGDIIGRGRTEAEAIADLKAQEGSQS